MPSPSGLRSRHGHGVTDLPDAPRLFDPGEGTQQGRLSADRCRRQHQLNMLAVGHHPATGLRLWRDVTDTDGPGLTDLEVTCGGCVHAVKVSTGSRDVWKCEKHRLGLSHSAASDIRVSWPACELFESAP
jgi:hypothetical protein